MNKTLQLKEIHALSNAFATFEGKQKPKLMFAISQNTQKIEKTIKSLHDQYTNSIPESYKQFEKERDIVMNKFRAELQIPPNSFEFGDKQSEMEGEVSELADKYRDAINEYTEAMKEFDELLNEESEYNLQPIKIDNLPKVMALSTFEALKPIIKDVYEFEKFQLTKIDISKFQIFKTISMIGEVNQAGLTFPTKVVHRLSYFMENFREIAKEIVEARQKHARIPEFVEYQGKKNAIINDTSLSAEESKDKIAELDASIDAEVLKSAGTAEDEMHKITASIVQIDVPKIKLDMLDDEMDGQLFSMLLPLIEDTAE